MFFKSKKLSAAERLANTDKLVAAIKKHDTTTVIQLIPVSDPKANSSYALTYAVELGYIDLYHLLLPHCHPEHNYGETLLAAVRIGNFDIVQQLFDLSNDTTSNTLAFQLAVKLGHEDLVRFFLPKVDPKQDNSIVLQYAVEKGDKHINIVEMLIPFVDVKARNSEALETAVCKRYKFLIDALVPHSNYENMASKLERWGYSTVSLLQAIESHQKHLLKERLMDAIVDERRNIEQENEPIVQRKRKM